MNNKAQIGVGQLLMVAITVIVGLVLMVTIAQSIGTSTNTATIANHTETLAANGASVYIDEYRAISSIVITNATDNVVVPAANYTVTNNILHPTTGVLSIRITTDTAGYALLPVQVAGTVQPLTYIADSGGRALAGIILVFFALSIAVVAMSPVVQTKFLESIGR